MRPLCREEVLVPLRGGPVPPRGGPSAAERRPLCREEALCAERSSVLRGLEEAPVSGGGSLCRMVLLLYAEGEAPVSGGGPCAAGRRPLCREEAPVPPRGGPLCRKVFCAERIGGGPCVGRRLLCREEALCAGSSCPLC